MSRKAISKDKDLQKQFKKCDKQRTKANALEKDLINNVKDFYMDKEARDNLIREARAFNYSESTVVRIEEKFKDFSKKTVMEYNDVTEIMDMKQHIKEKKTESLFSRIANIVIQNDDDE